MAAQESARRSQAAPAGPSTARGAQPAQQVSRLGGPFSSGVCPAQPDGPSSSRGVQPAHQVSRGRGGPFSSGVCPYQPAGPSSARGAQPAHRHEGGWTFQFSSGVCSPSHSSAVNKGPISYSHGGGGAGKTEVDRLPSDFMW
jgi:hypothetical protein